MINPRLPRAYPDDDPGVFSLLTSLCGAVARECGVTAPPAHVRKMRARAYEVLLHRESVPSPRDKTTSPVSDLLACFYVRSLGVKSSADQGAVRDLQVCVKKIREARLCETVDSFENVLRLLVRLKNEVSPDNSSHIQDPFTLGQLEALLPRLPRDSPSSPLPYACYPAHVFLLPRALAAPSPPHSPPLRHRPSIYTEYTVNSFHSSHSLECLRSSGDTRQPKLFEVPFSLTALADSGAPIYSNDTLLHYPRLWGPRDLQIPTSIPPPEATSNPPSPELEEMFRAASSSIHHDVHAVDIWELASSIDKNVPDDIWDIASKLPAVDERCLIAMCPRELSMWRQVYGGRYDATHVVSERQFIRDVMYLVIGIESHSFRWSEEHRSFSMRSSLLLEGISKESVLGYTAGLLSAGTCYRRLYGFAFDEGIDDVFYGHGYIFEAAKHVVRQFLLKFRLKATEIFGQSFRNSGGGEENCLPTLLQVMFRMEPLQYEIETVASIYKVIDADDKAKLPSGAGLMTYLYSEISLITHAHTAATMHRSLFSICKVYFKFIERFIFQGELDDRHDEFFIRKDPQHVHSQSKRYWDRGFSIGDAGAVPEFLRGVAKYILLCGKSFRLLKLCNPNDPLVLLISTDHPSVLCCSSFAQIRRQQRLLELYRTRCLFVHGAPVTFRQLVLKREAEKKAFTEMASVKQAETLEKIVAERKRLAQLIIAEKQHNLRILEAAIAETKASKSKAKKRGNMRTELEIAVDKAQDEADTILRDEERNKMLEYYSKLNLEVEKRTAHTEWKIKRLQLDPERMQLLSTEERNLKREKLELEHVKYDDGSGSNSFYSAESVMAPDQNIDEVSSDVVMRDVGEDNIDAVTEMETAKTQQFSCSIINTANAKDIKHSCTNENKLDSQGNIIVPIVLVNEGTKTTEKTLSKDTCNPEIMTTRLDALKNKQKVLSHDFGQLDSENNIAIVTETFDLYKINTGDSGTLKHDQYKYGDCNKAFVEAERNKLKVLGSKIDVTTTLHGTDPQTVERNPQSEARRNKLNVLTTDDDKFKLKSKSTGFLLESVSNYTIIGSNSQTEAKRNKLKVLGTDDDNFKLKSKCQSTELLLQSESKCNILCSDAQTEAKRNKLKVLGTDDDNFKLKSKSQSSEQLDNFNVNIASIEARRNRLKALGNDGENCKIFNRSQSIDYLTVAQKEALINKQRVLGTEYHLEVKSSPREPLNVAQQEAVRNKTRILTSDYEMDISNSAKIDAGKRATLTLDLKDIKSRTQEKVILGITPTTGGLTPGDFFTQLDMETPTTAEVPFGGPSTAELLSPRNISESIFHGSKHENDLLSSDGFKFPSVMLEVENPENEEPIDDRAIEIIEDFTSSPLLDLHLNKHFDCIKSSIWQLENKSYNFASFDPFGVKGATFDTNDHLSCKMFADMKKSFYTSPVDILKETQKKPYGDMFNFRSNDEENPDDSVFENVDIATLTACFQRSILLPLSYQLEMVNNSILTYYLIDLDMYEHLRSLKDYFFLMDGEFSGTICQNLFQMLLKIVNPDELLNFATLHSILDKALGSSITNVNKFSENLSFTMTEPPLSFQHSSPDVLQCLSLTYAVSWPMNIILSAEALSRYGRVFQYLLKMRRISWMLGQDFEVLKLSARTSRTPRQLLNSPQYNSVQLYRHMMAALLRALDSYIVTTCIQSSWTELEGDLMKARTLDDLYDCHVLYVKKVLFRCLLNKRSAPVMKLLNDIFTVVLRFSHVLRTRSWVKQEATGHFTIPCFIQLEELFHLFEKLTQHLHKTISRLMECGYQPHLAELLTMINLNGHYDPGGRSQNSLLDATV